MPHIIKLPIDKTFKHYLSSESYYLKSQQALGYLDLLYTYVFRYPRLLAVDLGRAVNSQGFAIDYTAAHSGAGFAVTALFLAMALVNTIQDYQKEQQQAEEKVNRYRGTYQRVKNYLTETHKQKQQATVLDNLTAEVKGTIDQPAELEQRELVNAYLRKILQEKLLDTNTLSERYQRIEITADGYVEIEPKQQPPQEQKSLWKKITARLPTIAYTAWLTLGLASFVYWILWMAAGVLTGYFAPVGIGSWGIAAFIAPFAAAALYPLIKLRNWWRHRNNQVQKKDNIDHAEKISDAQLQASADLNKLLRYVLYLKEKERLLKELDNQQPLQETNTHLEGDDQVRQLGNRRLGKTVMTFVSVTIGTYVVSQYVAWILRDFLQVAANVSLNTIGFALGFGIAMMVASVAYGAYKAYQKYGQVNAYQKAIEQECGQREKTLEQVYQQKLAMITELIQKLEMSKIDQLWLKEQQQKLTAIQVVPVQVPKVNVTWQQQLKQFGLHLYNFLDGATTGIMLLRIVAIAGSAIFLPFTAIALANPYTLAALLVVGIVYGLFKAYENYVNKNERAAQALYEARQEKITFLQQQSELADLQIKVLEKKLEAPKVQDDNYILNKSSPSAKRIALFKHKEDHHQPCDRSPLQSHPNNKNAA